MNYLLKGGEFNNKGAEAMTLVALSHILKIDPNANVFMFYSDKNVSLKLKKEVALIDNPSWWLRERIGRFPIGNYKARLKDFIKLFLLGKHSFWGKKKYSEKLLRKIDHVIDISGFAFSSKWGDDGTIEWLDEIKLMQSYGAKIWIMPQSFGPFDFSSNYVIEYGKQVLSSCELIFARESTGLKLLRDLGLQNVEHMVDSVLLEKDFDPSFLIENFDFYKEDIPTKNSHNICIVPNFRLIDQGNKSKNTLINFYSKVITNYKNNFDIYLIAHAGEDLSLCKQIKEKFTTDKSVILIDHVLFSFNYEAFIKKMDFIISSRYHAIVHAYKQYVPAVILGWADKYQGIASELNQEAYLIDLDNMNDSLNIIQNMTNNFLQEKEIIKIKLAELQQDNCYRFLKEIYGDI